MSDNGTEYIAKTLQDFIKTQGIVHEKTTPGERSQNGVVERANRLFKLTYRTLLKVSGLTSSFWENVLQYSAAIWDSLPRKGKSKSPYKMLTERPPKYSCYLILGAKGFARNSLNNKQTYSLPIIILGFPTHQAGYLVYDTKKRRIRTIRDLRLDETGVIQRYLKRTSRHYTPFQQQTAKQPMQDTQSITPDQINADDSLSEN